MFYLINLLVILRTLIDPSQPGNSCCQSDYSSHIPLMSEKEQGEFLHKI